MFADRLRLLLLALTVVYAIAFGIGWGMELSRSSGYLFQNGTPVGGDFVNLWTVARLVLMRDFAGIYDPAAYDAFQQSWVGGYIGLRLWAYPPHSLLFVWPFGLIGYHLALVLWSAIGLAALAWGCRRFGFGRMETAILVLSPASMASLYFGQTGNVAAALLLVALAGGRGAPYAAASLTMKPQAGFLLPILWLVERRWTAIVIAAAGTAILVAASIVWFGTDAWRAYAGETLPLLDRLERHGDGFFMLMIPSAFMAFRTLGVDGDLAANLHLVFAAIVVAVLVWRLIAVRDNTARAAMLLLATTLATPYMHTYDLAILLAGGLLVGKLWAHRPAVYILVVLVWALPQLVILVNATGVPLSPLLILPLFGLAAFPPLKRL